MVAAQVIGHDAAIALGGLGGYFELNVMMPLMAHDLLSSIEMMSNGVHAFSDHCVAGLKADEIRCREAVERSLALATALAPAIGYDRAAEISKEAHRTGRTVREVALEWGVLSPETLEAVLDPIQMTEPMGNEQWEKTYDDYKNDWGNGPFGVERVIFEGTGRDGAFGRFTTNNIRFDDEQAVLYMHRRWYKRTADGHEFIKEYLGRKHPVTAAEVRSWLEQCGFNIQEVFGSQKGEPYTPSSERAIFWAVKPG